MVWSCRARSKTVCAATDSSLKLMQEHSFVDEKERGDRDKAQFAVEIWESDRVLAREPVSLADLTFVRDETWIHGVRTGTLGWNLHDLPMSVLPRKRRSLRSFIELLR